MFLPFLVFSLKQDCHSNGGILLIFVKHLLLLPSTSHFFPLWYFSVLDKLLAFHLFLWCPLVCLCSLFNIPLVLVLYLVCNCLLFCVQDYLNLFSLNSPISSSRFKKYLKLFWLEPNNITQNHILHPLPMVDSLLNNLSLKE